MSQSGSDMVGPTETTPFPSGHRSKTGRVSTCMVLPRIILPPPPTGPDMSRLLQRLRQEPPGCSSLPGRSLDVTITSPLSPATASAGGLFCSLGPLNQNTNTGFFKMGVGAPSKDEGLTFHQWMTNRFGLRLSLAEWMAQKKSKLYMYHENGPNPKSVKFMN